MSVGADVFTDAPTIALGETSDPTPNVGYTTDPADPYNITRSAWWQLDVAAGTTVVVDTFLSTSDLDYVDTTLTLYRGPAGGTLEDVTRVARNDDSDLDPDGSYRSLLTYTLEDGFTYWVGVGCFGDDITYVLRVREGVWGPWRTLPSSVVAGERTFTQPRQFEVLDSPSAYAVINYTDHLTTITASAEIPGGTEDDITPDNEARLWGLVRGDILSDPNGLRNVAHVAHPGGSAYGLGGSVTVDWIGFPVLRGTFQWANPLFHLDVEEPDRSGLVGTGELDLQWEGAPTCDLTVDLSWEVYSPPPPDSPGYHSYSTTARLNAHPDPFENPGDPDYPVRSIIANFIDAGDSTEVSDTLTGWSGGLSLTAASEELYSATMPVPAQGLHVFDVADMQTGPVSYAVSYSLTLPRYRTLTIGDGTTPVTPTIPRLRKHPIAPLRRVPAEKWQGIGVRRVGGYN